MNRKCPLAGVGAVTQLISRALYIELVSTTVVLLKTSKQGNKEAKKQTNKPYVIKVLEKKKTRLFSNAVSGTEI